MPVEEHIGSDHKCANLAINKRREHGGEVAVATGEDVYRPDGCHTSHDDSVEVAIQDDGCDTMVGVLCLVMV